MAGGNAGCLSEKAKGVTVIGNMSRLSGWDDDLESVDVAILRGSPYSFFSRVLSGSFGFGGTAHSLYIRRSTPLLAQFYLTRVPTAAPSFLAISSSLIASA
jgi:hypothetical protein